MQVLDYKAKPSLASERVERKGENRIDLTTSRGNDLLSIDRTFFLQKLMQKTAKTIL
jgi:hypothetical protein